MPGILTGIVKGLDRAHQYDMDQAHLGIAQRQLQDAETQRKRENTRQDVHDQLDASAQEVQDAANGSRADLNVIGGVPEAPTGTVPNDPKLQQEWYAKRDAREAYLNGDTYKNAVANTQKSTDQLKDVYGRHRAILGKLAGDYAGEVNNDAARTEYLLHTTGLDGVSKRQFANYLIGKHKIDPGGFIKDPQTGRSDYEDAAQQLYDGFQTGNWDGKEKAISLLVPEQHLAVGEQLPNGSTVTRSQASHAFIDPNDPDYVHISTVMQHEDGNGGRGAVQSPHMDPDGIRIPIATLVDRAKSLFDGVNLMRKPEAQAKLMDAMQTGDSALHEFMRLSAKAGVPPPGLIPVKRGETLIDPITHKTVAEGAQYVGQQKQIFDELQDAYASGDPDRIQAAEEAARSLHPSKYQVGGGGGGGGAPAAKPLKAGDMNFTIRAAQNKYMTSKGFRRQGGKWVDKDGNEPDDETESDLSTIETAVTDAGQDGKRLKIDEAVGAVGGMASGARAAKPGDTPDKSLPFPESAAAAVKGKHYQTAKGVLLWNGQTFVPPTGTAAAQRGSRAIPAAPNVAAPVDPRVAAKVAAEHQLEAVRGRLRTLGNYNARTGGFSFDEPNVMGSQRGGPAKVNSVLSHKRDLMKQEFDRLNSQYIQLLATHHQAQAGG